MRGLLGDATEDMVERLDDGKDKDTNEEEEYKMAAILCECGGLDAILNRLAHVKDFVQGHHLVSAALKLLGFCVRLKVNRQHLLKPHLNTLDTLLTILDKVSASSMFCMSELQLAGKITVLIGTHVSG